MAMTFQSVASSARAGRGQPVEGAEPGAERGGVGERSPRQRGTVACPRRSLPSEAFRCVSEDGEG